MSNTGFTILALLFSLGFAFHVLKAASRGVDHGVSCSKKEWIEKYWSAVLIRWGFALTIFILYANNPDMANKLFGAYGFTASLALPITKCTSPLLGYFADSALDLIAKKVPILNRELPTTDGEAA